jgi:hypothetical protein
VRRASSSRTSECPEALQKLSTIERSELIDITPLCRRDARIAFERLVNLQKLADIAAIVGGERSNIGWRLKHHIYPALLVQLMRGTEQHRMAQ